MNQALISAFCAELPKVATAGPTWTEVGKKLVEEGHAKNLALLGVGGVTALALRRGLEDLKTGRQVRLQQSGRGY